MCVRILDVAEVEESCIGTGHGDLSPIQVEASRYHSLATRRRGVVQNALGMLFDSNCRSFQTTRQQHPILHSLHMPSISSQVAQIARNDWRLAFKVGGTSLTLLMLQVANVLQTFTSQEEATPTKTQLRMVARRFAGDHWGPVRNYRGLLGLIGVPSSFGEAHWEHWTSYPITTPMWYMDYETS